MSRPDLFPHNAGLNGSATTTLLVLDDSAEDREIVRRLLSSDPKQDYVVHEFTDIEQALEACDRLRPDCVLLDYSLGDGTGLDFLAARNAKGQPREFAVVMLTGSGNEEVAAQAFRSGAHDYLAKGTFSPDTLQRTIANAIYKMRTERLLAQQRAELELLFQEAQEANARKDQFLAALSHELRTPLSPILSAVSGANPEELSREELQEVFTTVRRNVLLEARLIDDLLDLTRIAKGKLRLDLHAVDAHKVLRHALDTCEEDISKKRLRLILSHGAENHTVMADPARLQQIFWNILKNAVKFTPVGGEIRISTANTPSGAFIATVTDSGIGMAPEAIPNIFKAFEQGSTDVPKKFGGLGLGLAIAHALVDAHHGKIAGASDGINQGASFTVELPTSDGVPITERKRPSDAPDQEATTGRSAEAFRQRILLVEDHPDTARQLSRLMQRRGYEVVAVHSIADAVNAFSREHIDAVVSDIGLPDGDGVDVMKQLHLKRVVPGIALSGYGTDGDINRSLEAGFSAHLVKPVEWEELDAVLARVLASHASPSDETG